MEEMEIVVQPAKKKWRWIGVFLAALVLLEMAALGYLFLPDAWAYVRHGVKTVRSGVDYDHDLIDDTMDMMLGARFYVRTNPVYDDSYVSGGYPPSGRGVCTDVIWKAFRAAGYDLKAMVDADIAKNPSAYPLSGGVPDQNIDFRRVVNLEVFFRRNALSLTTDASEIEQWQPGDIVIYKGHIAMVSDRRNAEGVPYIIHHTGHGAFEEDRLTYQKIIGHYRWTGGEDTASEVHPAQPRG